MINWNATLEEIDYMAKICKRAERVFKHLSIGKPNRMTMMMDLTACHANGCPLDLGALLTAPEFDFVHDICGIARHIDRDTGELKDCFIPRTAKR